MNWNYGLEAMSIEGQESWRIAFKTKSLYTVSIQQHFKHLSIMRIRWKT